MKPDIDVLMASKMERLDNAVCQVKTALHSGLNVRVTVATSKPWTEFYMKFSEQEWKHIRKFETAPEGAMGTPAIAAAMDQLDWADWYYNMGDDDCLMPWALKTLWEAREGVSMVIGQALCVTRKEHEDFTHYKVGRLIMPAKVSGVCALLNFRDLEKLEKPWWNTKAGMPDFELLDRMSDKYKFKIIPTVVHVLSLA